MEPSGNHVKSVDIISRTNNVLVYEHTVYTNTNYFKLAPKTEENNNWEKKCFIKS